jgi:hypothetical protein
MYEQPRPGSNIKAPIIMALIGGVLIIYLIGVFNTGNWLWPLPIQPKYEPSRIVIHDGGQTVDYHPGVAGFVELTAALDASLAGFSNLELIPIGLSEDTLQEYDQSGVVMEVYYPQDIRFNTIARMRNINQLLIPIVGRHADLRYVFLGGDGRWMTGALVMENDQPIREALRELGHVE